MQTSNFLRTFGEAFRQGCRSCFQSVQWSVISKKTLFWEISSFLHVFGLSVKKNEDRWRKSFARASNEKPMYLDDCSRKTTLVVRKTLSCIFEPSVKKVWEIDEIISAVVFEKVFTFPEKNFARKFFFVKIMFFFQFFFDIELSVLRPCAETLLQESQEIDLETQQKFLWGKLSFKIVSFCSFCRHRISFGLSSKVFDGVVESVSRVFSRELSAKTHFWDLSNFLHVFGLSVKKMRTVGEKASQGLQMRNLCIWMIFLRKTTLVVRKSFSSIFELSEKKVRELDQKIPAVFSKENSTFPAKNFARKLFFREYYVFFSLFFDIELLNLKSLICKPNQKVCGRIFFL